MKEINITIQNILSYLEDQSIEYMFSGNKTDQIIGFSDPSEYKQGTVIWIGSIKNFLIHDNVPPMDVALAIIDNNFKQKDQFCNYIITKDPRNTFMLLVENYYPIIKETGIESSAIIESGAEIGDGCYIGHHSVIEGNVKIGKGTIIQNNVVIHSGTVIGENCRIEDNTSIGNSGFGFRKPKNELMTRMPHLGNVIIDNNVEIGPCTIIYKGTFMDTTIAEGVKIDGGSYIGHNVKIGRNSLVIGTRLSGNSQIGEFCNIINAQISNRISIGNYVKVGIGSVVLQNIPDEVSCFGNPAKIIITSKNDLKVNESIKIDLKSREDFFKFVAKIMEVSFETLSEASEYGVIPEWDSLMHLRLIAELEDKYGIVFPIDKVASIKTLGRVMDFIWSQKS